MLGYQESLRVATGRKKPSPHPALKKRWRIHTGMVKGGSKGPQILNPFFSRSPHAPFHGSCWQTQPEAQEQVTLVHREDDREQIQRAKKVAHRLKILPHATTCSGAHKQIGRDSDKYHLIRESTSDPLVPCDYPINGFISQSGMN